MLNTETAKTKIISKKEIEEDVPFAKDTEKELAKTPSSLIAIIFFIIMSTIYLIIIFITLPAEVSGSSGLDLLIPNTTYFLIYILILVIGNYFINLNTTTSLCGGKPQWAATMINTVVPWVFIFGVMNLLLVVFPGWISPFANTIGFAAMNILGLQSILNEILSTPKDIVNKEVAKGISQIYSNNSVFINQFPENPDKFNELFNNLLSDKYFNAKADDKVRGNLYKLIRFKNLVGLYVWNILTGILVCTVSYNFILNISCANSIKNMKEKRNDFLVAEKIRENSKNNERVYYPFVIGKDNPDLDVKSSSYATTG